MTDNLTKLQDLCIKKAWQADESIEALEMALKPSKDRDELKAGLNSEKSAFLFLAMEISKMKEATHERPTP